MNLSTLELVLGLGDVKTETVAAVIETYGDSDSRRDCDGVVVIDGSANSELDGVADVEGDGVVVIDGSADAELGGVTDAESVTTTEAEGDSDSIGV